jgi:hypothetical protein
VSELQKLHVRVDRLEELGTQIRLGVAILMLCGGTAVVSAWLAGSWMLKHAMVDALHSPEVATEIRRIAMTNESK